MTDKNNKAEADGKPEKEKKVKPEGENKAKAHQHVDGEKKAAQPSVAPAVADPAVAAKPAKAKALRNVPAGIAHINATFNNTQVTITDLKGGTLAWSSAGRMGFKGTRKSTAYAATVVAQEAARLVAPYRMQEIEVRVQGPGSGRESAIRAFQSAGMIITVIKDVTPMPHNGCRARKRRRV
jgi:small subunit ribosomal protein S11